MCQLRQFQVVADDVRVVFCSFTTGILGCIEIHFGIVFAVIGFAVYFRFHLEADFLLVVFCIGIRNLYRAGFLAQLQVQRMRIF